MCRISCGLAAILNAMSLPAAIARVRRTTVFYPTVLLVVFDRYSVVTMACMRLQSHWEIAFLQPEVGRWLPNIGGMVGSP